MIPVRASVKILPVLDPAKHVEKCGRSCYQSYEKITPESHMKFIDGIIKRKHENVLENLGITIHVKDRSVFEINNILGKLRSFFGLTFENGRILLSGNIHAWRDLVRSRASTIDWNNALLDQYNTYFKDLEKCMITSSSRSIYKSFSFYSHNRDMYYNDIELLTHFPITANFNISKKLSAHFLRHRVFSPLQESSRFCNYSKEKFGGEIVCIIPVRYIENERKYSRWIFRMKQAEEAYFEALNDGDIPEDAAEFLPGSVKTEINITGTLNQWIGFHDKRTLEKTGKVAAAMLEVSVPLLKDLHELFPSIFENQISEYKKKCFGDFFLDLDDDYFTKGDK